MGWAAGVRLRWRRTRLVLLLSALCCMMRLPMLMMMRRGRVSMTEGQRR